jgi:hypothetical protein
MSIIITVPSAVVLPFFLPYCGGARVHSTVETRRISVFTPNKLQSVYPGGAALCLF